MSIDAQNFLLIIGMAFILLGLSEQLYLGLVSIAQVFGISLPTDDDSEA